MMFSSTRRSSGPAWISFGSGSGAMLVSVGIGSMLTCVSGTCCVAWPIAGCAAAAADAGINPTRTAPPSAATTGSAERRPGRLPAPPRGHERGLTGHLLRLLGGPSRPGRDTSAGEDDESAEPDPEQAGVDHVGDRSDPARRVGGLDDDVQVLRPRRADAHFGHRLLLVRIHRLLRDDRAEVLAAGVGHPEAPDDRGLGRGLLGGDAGERDRVAAYLPRLADREVADPDLVLVGHVDRDAGQ